MIQAVQLVFYFSLILQLMTVAAITKDKCTDTERTAFVNAHNSKRGGLSPAAKNMKKVEWNCELESMAQEWANKCVWAHGQPTRDPKPFNPIGQNNWAGSGSYDPAGAVTSWFNEVSDFTYSDNSCATDKACGHYTQVVWANSYAIGCGISYCPGLLGWSPGGYFIVCNYGPAGNYNGVKPYINGASSSEVCTACDSGWSTCDSGLCSKGTPVNNTCPNLVVLPPIINGSSGIKAKGSFLFCILSFLVALKIYSMQ